MRLLVFTQKIDRNDSVLGFFHDWVIKISERCESVEVICIESGEYSFGDNVKIHQIGKGYGIGRLKYIFGVYRYLFLLRGKYDTVFVHMNQEYVFSLGLYWKWKGTPVFLWRNHPKGNLLTYLAILISTKVFCTSIHSFTARFKKVKIMPAGINTEIFRQVSGAVRKKYSVCMVGRLSPIKHNELALEALNILTSQGVQVSMSFIGGILDRDVDFSKKLHKYVEDNNLSKIVSFGGAVSPNKLPEIYSSFEICLNLTEPGSFDKTIVEAAGCGVIPLVSSHSFDGLLPQVCITDTSPQSIADSIKQLIDPTEQIKIQKDLTKFVESQSLDSLMKKLFEEIN
ncbi:MAG: hypothetical protein CEO12_199 [Parcubacteria group bacterium Gr01-1014_46]|nr:MAG: hypothetical protein CEO12_199 [Parcubacteria group bacterium Gr01-1014_46]